MRVVRDFSHCPSDCTGAAVALGNFDGVHLGHQSILRHCMEIAKKTGVPSAVMTFEPHPREFFARGKDRLRLYPLRRKLELLRDMGIDIAFLAHFNRKFSALSAQAFIEDLLWRKLKVTHVITGGNFAFGSQRQGNTHLLASEAKRLGFGFTACPPVLAENGQPISSSAIRLSLATGDVKKAASLLGRPYDIEGHVRRGEGRGKALGFPTANLSLSKLFKPRFGVYAVRALLDNKWQDGVANIGVKPTFGAFDPLLEAHLFAMDRILYGERLRVEFLDFIRDEQRFADAETLRQQMTRDCIRAKEVLHAGK